MEDQYGLADLRHYSAAAGRPFLPAAYPPPLFPPSSRSSPGDGGHPYYALNFASADHPIAPPAMAGGGFATESGGGGGDGGAGRWPRQETLTLLEIRSKLDPKFKEANQKGPLWDEVSRLMSEEYGYSRNGKKCREKFENLYKYYKKTKGGKAGRQDGKHYRFFRQLEALYGDHQTVSDQQQTNNNNNNNNFVGVGSDSPYEYFRPPQESLSSLISLSNSSDFDTSDESADDPKTRKKRGHLKAKIKDTIDSQMRRMMEKQEAWMEKMTRTIEDNEHERVLREEQWRKQDAERIEREHRMWAGEKAWIEARDAALMDSFRKMVAANGKLDQTSSSVVVDPDWDCVSDYLIKKRKESSRVIGGAATTNYDESSIGGGGGFDPNDSCFRYFNGGDGYGRIIN